MEYFLAERVCELHLSENTIKVASLMTLLLALFLLAGYGIPRSL